MKLSHDPATSLETIERALIEFPTLRDKLNRTLLITLHTGGLASVDEIYQAARSRIGRPVVPCSVEDMPADDNVQLTQRWDELEKAAVESLTNERAAEVMSPEQIQDLIALTRRREVVERLREIASAPLVQFKALADEIKRYCALPVLQTRIPEWEQVQTVVALIRHTISDQLEFIGVAKNYFKIRDFADLTDRLIGDDSTMGRIGGKAAGMLLAQRILEKALAEDPAAPQVPLGHPESFMVRSDVIEQFISYNSLNELRSQKYKPLDVIRQEYPLMVNFFKNAQFPPRVVEKLRAMLDRIGPWPLIVRSSSLLEDRFGASFSGKYRSIFVANQGPLENRLAELLGAMAEVYASILHSDPISYRRKHNLLDYDDDMGVLIQKVVGRKYRHYFFPLWAGVAFSRNEFPWSPRIRREDGLARLVFGLGTRAVDRVASDYPRMVPLGMPLLRPQASDREKIRYSQRLVDVINLAENRLEKAPFDELLTDEEALPGLETLVSINEDGELRPTTGKRINVPTSRLVLTFDRYVQETPYPAFIKWTLGVLEKAYGVPLDIEFAHDGEMFYLLQCRPQAWNKDVRQVRIPSVIMPGNRVFSAHRDIANGSVHGVEYVVLVDPRGYDAIPTHEGRLAVSTLVRQLNDALKDKKFILMGPGRWGSNDIKLGVKVGYADINNTAMLIEIARAKGDYVPEVSYGTHFFQDLVESKIRYLALFPDTPGNEFNEDFLLTGTRNALSRLVPGSEEWGQVVRVVHVPSEAHGLLLNVDMDGEKQEALGYLAPPE